MQLWKSKRVVGATMRSRKRKADFHALRHTFGRIGKEGLCRFILARQLSCGRWGAPSLRENRFIQLIEDAIFALSRYFSTVYCFIEKFIDLNGDFVWMFDMGPMACIR